MTIDSIEKNIKDQEQIDNVWFRIKSLFMEEMDKLPDIQDVKDSKTRKAYRKCQPYWNGELENLWFNVTQTEKQYLAFKVSANCDIPKKTALRLAYKDVQKLFDKKYRYSKRKFRDRDMEEL